MVIPTYPVEGRVEVMQNHKVLHFTKQWHGETKVFHKHPSGEGEGEYLPKFTFWNRFIEEKEIWGTVCMDKFAVNDNAAKVVCRQLGLPVGRNLYRLTNNNPNEETFVKGGEWTKGWLKNQPYDATTNPTGP